MTPWLSVLLIAAGLIYAAASMYLIWRVVFQPWVERVSDHLRVRREFPRWFL